MVRLTRSDGRPPAAPSAVSRLVRARSNWGTTPPSATFPSRSTPVWPARNTIRPVAATACEKPEGRASSAGLMRSVVIGSQGRGARRPVSPSPFQFRTCGFPAYGLPMIFLTWLRCPRIADGAAKPVQAVPVEPVFCPGVDLPGVQVPAPFLDHEATEPVHDVVIGLPELDGSVPGAEVVPPAAQDRVEVRDHLADVLPRAVSAGAVPDLLPEPLHGPLGRPPVQVVAPDAPLLPDPP